jgi:hypothetical protein
MAAEDALERLNAVGGEVRMLGFDVFVHARVSIIARGRVFPSQLAWVRP